jgi:hypothetical protein
MPISVIKRNLFFNNAFGGKPAILSLHLANPTDDGLYELDVNSVPDYERKEVNFIVPSNGAPISNADRLEFFFSNVNPSILNQAITHFSLRGFGVGDNIFWYGTLPSNFLLDDKVYQIKIGDLKLNWS